MRVQKTQNVSFQATLNITNKIDAQSALIKNICPQLESCGGPNVSHEITSLDNGLAALIFSKFSTEGKPSYRTFKRFELASAENIAQKIEELKTWVQNISLQSKG